MPMYQIDIQFDREDRTYNPKEVVSGVVIIQPETDIICRRLELHLRGPGQTKVLTTLFYEKAEWKIGNVYSYPFSFRAPRRPLTYHGNRLRIDWYVRVKADVPLSITDRIIFGIPSSEKIIYLKSEKPLQFTISSFAFHSLSIQRVLNEIPAHWGLVFGILAVMGGSLFAIMVIASPETSICQSLLAFAVTITGHYLLFRYLPIWLAARQLGEVKVEFSGVPENLGLMGVVKFNPKSTGQTQRIEMNLLIREITTESVSTTRPDITDDTRVHEHIVFAKKVADTQPHHFYSKEPFEAKIFLKSNSPLPPTYRRGDSRIEWLVTVKIGLSKWAIWKRKVFVEAK